MSDKCYNHTEYTEITQYNVEDADTFMGGKKYVPVFHWLQKRPWDDNPIEYHEWYVEIGWPADTPWDTEIYDDEILAISGKERPVHPDTIFVSPVESDVEVGKTITLNAIVTPAWSEFPIEWHSSDETKATVTPWNPATTATVNGIAEWENVKITAKSWAVDAFSTITVKKIAVTWVTLDKSEVSLTEWWTETLVATITPDDATYQWLSWESDDTDVVTIVADWKNATITAVAAWTATITVKSTDDNTKTATCSVTVTAPVVDEPTEPGE